MRVTKPKFSSRFKTDCSIEHSGKVLTGFGGLVVFMRYLWRVGVVKRLREKLGAHGAVRDYGGGSLALLILLFLVGGGRRLEHLRYFEEDGVLKRLAALRKMPSKATLSRFLRGFRAVTVSALMELNREFVHGHLRRVGVVEEITLDLDGTVVSTRGHAERTAKGYNPIRKGARSYRPLTLHVAETGQFYAIQNRAGNVADNTGALRFMQRQISALRRELPEIRILVRQDSAFFSDDLLSLYESAGIGYVCVARMYEDLALIIRNNKQWTFIRDGVDAFEFSFKMHKWQKSRFFVAYRFRLSEKEIAARSGEQLDLFRPNDAEYRYMLFVTNMGRAQCDTPAIHTFYSGRAGQEKDLGELKSEFAFDVLPCLRYAGNSAWQQLSMLGYNTTVGFTTEIVNAHAERTPTDDSREKKTRIFTQIRAKTLRFLHLNVPGILINRSGRTILQLPESRARQRDWAGFQSRIAKLRLAAPISRR